ncbi:MAG: DNA polymerase IV [Elusimicrobiota bacterium]
MSEKETKRFIIHVDMDAFFASVEQRDNPALKGRPVIVGADPKSGRGRGVVAACSYTARKYGIHSAMPISRAYRKCPSAVFLPVNMKKYQNESDKIFSIINTFSPKVQKLSIDEAFLDISGSFHLFKSPENAGLQLQNKIKNKRGISASVGLAPNKFLAKLASEHKKPDGFFVIKKDSAAGFLEKLEINKVQGIGEKTAHKMNSMGINTIKDLLAFKRKDIIAKFGKNGIRFFNLARGIDNSPVKSEAPPKSVSNEHTFPEDVSGDEKIKAVLLRLSDKVASRLRAGGLSGCRVSIKIRSGDFKTYTRAKSSQNQLNTTEDIYSRVCNLYKKLRLKKKIRLVGVKVDGFNSLKQKQLDLFQKKQNEKEVKLNRTVDQIRNKYGPSSIYRAGTGLNKTGDV